MGSKAKPAVKGSANTLAPEVHPDDTEGRAIARTVPRSTVQAATTLKKYSDGNPELTTFIEELAEQARLASDGDLSRMEEMLVAQAQTLNAIFNSLAREAVSPPGLPVQLELCLRLGLKAQSQCRATIETLAALKNPQPVAFVGQQNLAVQSAGKQSGQAGEYALSRPGN